MVMMGQQESQQINPLLALLSAIAGLPAKQHRICRTRQATSVSRSSCCEVTLLQGPIKFSFTENYCPWTLCRSAHQKRLLKGRQSSLNISPMSSRASTIVIVPPKTPITQPAARIILRNNIFTSSVLIVKPKQIENHMKVPASTQHIDKLNAHDAIVCHLP